MKHVPAPGDSRETVCAQRAKEVQKQQHLLGGLKKETDCPF